MSDLIKDIQKLTAVEALTDARTTVLGNMNYIIHEIDKIFGNGFSKNNPMFIAELTKAISIELNTTINAKVQINKS
ncbi:hypothetical protein AB7X21_01895 [Providencia rettgeri]|uniref:hypothetical protein n=1 Tax=Morganellaceae TaxID=1903414 RepID=UPI0010BE8CEA|nr:MULTISPECIES: hypothetical protein [Morganellaceae]ELB1227880.1 hypothetical protein [Proteus mirabilis]MCM2366078.1 hypothetical protein [Proteus sp. FZP2095]MCM2366092.1 hypothetical protein [Proteus sp. FZP2095]QCJ70045.1 hypothetical protein C9446_09385 [Providencia heimbachae]QCJ70057.1 hypothetical protein C9446_09450 [Providencia heimbachae]